MLNTVPSPDLILRSDIKTRVILLLFLLLPPCLFGGGEVFVPDAAVQRLAIQMDKKYFPLFRNSFGWINNADTGKIRQYYTDADSINLSGDPLRMTDLQRMKVLPVYSFGPFAREGHQLTFPINWNDSVNNDPSWQLWFQSLIWLRPMLKSADRDTLMAAYGVINDWIGQHLTYPVKGEKHAWGDHAPAERVVLLVEALQRLEKSGINDRDTWSNLRLSILNHFFFLGTLEKYLTWHNHAIIFDEKLIIALEKTNGFTLRDELLNLAFQRLFEQYRFSYTSEGVHREHSPCYHIGFSATLNDMIKSAGRLGIEVPEQIRHIWKMSNRFTENITNMGSSFPVGDCTRSLQKASPQKPGTSEPVKQDEVPVTFSFDLFPFSGWFFAVDTVTGIKFCTQSDFHSLSHYQRDETSFILTVGDQELIIDPGLYSYERSSVYDYYRSSRAHNMLVADSLQDLFDLGLTGLSGITRFLPTDGDRAGKTAVELVNPHYRKFGVELHRQYLFPGTAGFLIRDIIKSKARRYYRQLFHLWPGAQIKKADSALEISWEDSEISLMLISNYHEFNILEGKNDTVQGWYFPGFNKMAPAPVLELGMTLESGSFETLVVIKKGTSMTDRSDNFKAIFRKAMQVTKELEKLPRRELVHEPFPERWQPGR
jgi:hypothetical protein